MIEMQQLFQNYHENRLPNMNQIVFYKRKTHKKQKFGQRLKKNSIIENNNGDKEIK